MKKTIKRIFALVTVLVLCIAFCSCNEIKEMRKSQAFYSENAGEIIYQGKVYKSLDVQQLPDELGMRIERAGYITEKDVPVLLSKTFGKWMSYNHNKTIIEAGTYYVREDVYDYVLDLIKYPYMDDYCVGVEIEGSLDMGFEALKQRYLNVINEITYTVKPYSLYEDYYPESTLEDYAEIYKCDEKMVFQTLAYDIEAFESGEMFLTVYNSKNKNDDYYGRVYSVPDDKKFMLKEILAMDDDELF